MWTSPRPARRPAARPSRGSARHPAPGPVRTPRWGGPGRCPGRRRRSGGPGWSGRRPRSAPCARRRRDRRGLLQAAPGLAGRAAADPLGRLVPALGAAVAAAGGAGARAHSAGSSSRGSLRVADRHVHGDLAGPLEVEHQRVGQSGSDVLRESGEDDLALAPPLGAAGASRGCGGPARRSAAAGPRPGRRRRSRRRVRPARSVPAVAGPAAPGGRGRGRARRRGGAGGRARPAGHPRSGAPDRVEPRRPRRSAPRPPPGCWPTPAGRAGCRS